MKYLILIISLLAVGACGDSPSAVPPTGATPDKHPETKKLEAADAAGYDGKMLRDSVDKTLDKREEQQKELEEAQKAQQPDQKKDE